jgi:hypothetical protein
MSDDTMCVKPLGSVTVEGRGFGAIYIWTQLRGVAVLSARSPNILAVVPYDGCSGYTWYIFQGMRRDSRG